MAKQEDNIHAGHRERMRERFEQNGLEGFHDHEVLEMLLFHAIRRGDTNALAHELLREFGTLEGVLWADPESLCHVRGVGENTAYFLKFMSAFHDYVEQSRLRGLALVSFENRCLYFRSRLSGCTDENMLVACLDDQMKVIRCITVAKGIPGQVQVEPQTLVRVILQTHCRSVILAHNHPNGAALPSADDIYQTNAIARILHSIDIELNDHIIVAGSDTYSMRKNGTYEPSML